MFTHISKKKNHTSITRIRNRYNEVIELTQCDESRKKQSQDQNASEFEMFKGAYQTRFFESIPITLLTVLC